MYKRIVFIIPGYGCSADETEFKLIGKMFIKKGIEPIYVNIPWKRTTISQNVEYFLENYAHVDAQEKYILGHSFGAVIAFIASTKMVINLQILCSLSPYFAEDIPKKSWKLIIGKKRSNDLLNISSAELVHKTTTKTFMIMGSKEHPILQSCVHRIYDSLSIEKQLLIVQGAKHDIANEKYLEAIKVIIEDQI